MLGAIFSTLGAGLGPIGAIVGALVGNQLDKKWFGPVYGVLNDRQIVGAAPGTTYPLIFGRWRCEAAVIAGLPRRRYTFSGQAKYRGYFGVIYGRCPHINPGDLAGATIEKIWLQGKLHYDFFRANNHDKPRFFLPGNQTRPPAGLLTLQPNAQAYQGLIGCGWPDGFGLHLTHFGESIPNSHSALVSTGTISLEGVANGIAKEAEVDEDLYDFSELAGVPVRGCAYLGQMTFADWLAVVFEFFSCDLYPGGGKQRGRPRAAPTADFTISWDELDTVIWEGEGVPMNGKLICHVEPALEMPKGVVVKYRNSDDDFNAGSIFVPWPHSPGERIETKDYTMIACTAAEAEAAGYRWLDEQDKKRRHFEISLGIERSGVTAGAILDIPMGPGDGARRMLVRVERVPEDDPQGPSNYLVYRVSDSSFTQTGEDPGNSGSVSSGSTDIEWESVTAKVFSGPMFRTDLPSLWKPWFAVCATWAAGVNTNGVQIWYRLQGTTAWSLFSPDGDPVFCAITGRTPIGVTTSLMAAGATAGAFEVRPVSVALDQASDELVDTSEELALAGYRTLSSDSNVMLIEDEVCAPTDVTDDGGGAWTVDNVLTGLNSTPFGSHPIGSMFAALSRGDTAVVNVADEWTGQVVEVCIKPPGIDTFDRIYEVTIADPTPPWNPGPATPADHVELMEYDWDEDGKQNFNAFPNWDSAADVKGQAPWGRFSTSTNNGVSWTERAIGANLKVSIAAGTIKVRFEPMGGDGELGTPIYSANKAYRNPPSGGGGGAGSSRGTRALFASTGASSPISATALTEFDVTATAPAGVLVETGQILHFRMAFSLANGDANYDFEVRANSVVLASLTNINLAQEFTQGVAELWCIASSVGAAGELRCWGNVAMSREDGQTDIVKLNGVATVDTTDALELSGWWKWYTAGTGREITAEQVSLVLIDTVGAGGVLPTATEGQTLRFNATTGLWEASSVILNDGTGVSLSGTLDMGTNPIEGVADPANAQDAATKAYVDAAVAGVTPVTINFADDETPTGALGTANWTLAHAPNPASSLILVVDDAVLTQLTTGDGDYSLAGAAITILDSDHYPVTAIRAWYRY